MSLNPTTSSKVVHGFWHSHGVALPKGPVLTLTTKESKFFTSLIALLISWAVSRLYRIFAAAIFHLFFKQRDSGFNNSIAVVMAVNIPSPLDGIFATYKRFWRTKAYLSIFAASLTTFILPLAIVAWVSFLPAYREGRLVPNHCGLAPIASDRLLLTAYNARRMQWADDAFRDVDDNETDASTDIKATRPAALPIPSQSYVLKCPPGASACTITYPFTFASNYTLQSKHFGLDTDKPFSLHVSDTCYRPRGAAALLPIDVPGDPKLYGLFYGPLNFTRGRSTFSSTPYTEAVYEGQEFRPGYRLSQYAASVDDLFDGDWSPNSTLLLGGDTTILFYYIGGVAMVNPSSDPLFATDPSLNLVLPTQEVYYRSNIVTPIVCDTKYQFCAEGGQHCSPLGGITNLIKWLGVIGQPDLSSLFAASLYRPPIYQASLGSGAVVAAQTTPGGMIQLDPDSATAQRELGRLVQAGMVMLASYARLSASGYWNVGLGSQGLSPTISSLLCESVIIETKDSISTPLIPYIALLLVIVIVIVVSYADRYLPTFGVKWWQNHSTNWAIHYSGPMLRRLTEVIRGKKLDGSPTDEWPFVEDDTLGPDVVECDGVKRFELAPAVLPKVAEVSVRDISTPEKDASRRSLESGTGLASHVATPDPLDSRVSPLPKV